eukprot:TRINITY_DN1930_c0_g1_i1.p3 TRINITY_DN1930_c0_g1~~TRINITY_DN1930_c0_g1_i1.p3  ORF type:complete len:108 (-),score=7.73 TRINITY_DN1930_c0_g1_i1:488-811(-)
MGQQSERLVWPLLVGGYSFCTVVDSRGWDTDDSGYCNDKSKLSDVAVEFDTAARLCPPCRCRIRSGARLSPRRKLQATLTTRKPPGWMMSYCDTMSLMNLSRKLRRL